MAFKRKIAIRKTPIAIRAAIALSELGTEAPL
jgi:hypothetical protein